MDFFARMGSGGRDRMEEAANLRYETLKVKFVMSRSGLGPQEVRRLSRLHEDRYGVPGLSFGIFREEYPTYPVLLQCSRLEGLRLHTDPKSILPVWFKNFESLPFVPPFVAFHDSIVAVEKLGGRGVGLVFPRKGFQQGLVVHTAVANGSGWEQGPCFCFRGGRKGARLDLFVRPFVALVDEIYNNGHGWSPD
jgi:hypothetical protein